MKEININYAYKGFLYEPLFLADSLNYFPENIELKYRGGDVETIKSLTYKTETNENWFAICDPFVRDFSKIKSAMGKDDIYIVGSFIDRLPIWLFNDNPKITPIKEEKDLHEYRNDINHIRCYEKYNTGYLIGNRLTDSRFLDKNEDSLQLKHFGNEFEPYDDKTIILTSDILRIVKDIDKEHIIFNYPQAGNTLNPFLFTGIFTLKSVIENHLYSVLSVLAGLRKAINLLSEGKISEEVLENIIKRERYSYVLENLTNEEKKKTVRLAIHTLFKEEKIYPSNFDITEAKNAYNNAKKIWENLAVKSETNGDLPKTFPSIEEVDDPIPSLLLKENWKTNINIPFELISRNWSDDNLHYNFYGLLNVAPKSDTNKKNKLITDVFSVKTFQFWITVVLLFILGYFMLTNFPHENPNNSRTYPALLFNLIAYVIQVILSLILILEILFPTLNNYFGEDENRIPRIFGTVLALIGIQFTLIRLS